MTLSALKGMLRTAVWTLVAGVFVALVLNLVRSDHVDKRPRAASAVQVQPPPVVSTRPQPAPDTPVQFDADAQRKNEMGDRAVALTRPCMRQAALARLKAGERDRKRLEEFAVQLCAGAIRQTMASLNEPGAEELLKMLATVEVENAIVLGR